MRAFGRIRLIDHLAFIIVDGLVKSPKTPFSVIPVKTGIQEIQEVLDSRSPPSRGQASRE